MLRVISLNLNGLRSAVRKGYLPWLARQRADCVCMQEVKAQQCDLDPAMPVPEKLKRYFDCGERRGYGGVAMYTKVEPDSVTCGFGSKEFDREGRFLRCDFGPLSIVSLYMPSGSGGPERQRAKFRFLDEFMPVLRSLVRSGRELIICGDWNIAHQEIDLKNWRSNQRNSGFLPEERAWLTKVLGEIGWIDVFRRLDLRPDQYTWWSTRGQAWAKNVGWRIDYQIATPGIAATALRARIYTARRFSDHAPLVIDYDWTIESARGQQTAEELIAAPKQPGRPSPAPAAPRPAQHAARRQRN